MRTELEALRKELSTRRQGRNGPGDSTWEQQVGTMQQQLDELEDMLTKLAAQEEKSRDRIVVVSHAELQNEIDRFKRAVRRAEGLPEDSGRVGGGPGGEKRLDYDLDKVYAPAPAQAGGLKKGEHGDGDGKEHVDGGAHGSGKAGSKDDGSQAKQRGEAVKKADGKDHGKAVDEAGGKVKDGRKDGSKHGHKHGHKHGEDKNGGAGAGVPRPAGDKDMNMPFGDLEPFGREDTARELTEASLRESDAMVDQIERAEVAEEQRAMFRALTRLRGVAITSYDGVARAHTGNLDEFSQKYQWRKKHPIRHLANEESDVKRWAFPGGGGGDF